MDYLRKKAGLPFSDWKCTTVLFLPNASKPVKAPRQANEHIILTGDYQNNNVLEMLNITEEYEVTREYEILATTLLACTHSASILTRRGIPLLSDDKQKETPDIDSDNDHPSYVLWSPKQVEAIESKETRLLIHGTAGGPSQVLMAKAKDAKMHNKEDKIKYILLADTSDEYYLKRIESFCKRNNIQFFGILDCPWYRNFVVNGDKTKLEEMKKGIEKIGEDCNQLFIDEIPQVNRFEQQMHKAKLSP